MIQSGFTTSFKQELLQGVHDFTTGTGDSFYIALYSSTANINASTTAYTSTGEVSADGYTEGGSLLTVVTPTTSGMTALVDFSDVTWTANITARAALIYNFSNSNKSVMVLDFGTDRVSLDNVFTVTFPLPDAEHAIIRL